MEAKAFFDLMYEQRNEEVKKLVEEDKSYLNLTDESKRNALHKVAFYGNLELVQFFIEQGLDVNALDQYHYTAIQQAADNNHFDVMDYLLDQGADVNLLPTGFSASGLISVSYQSHKQGEGMSDALLKRIIDATKQLDAKCLSQLLYHHKFDLYEYALQTEKTSKDQIFLTLEALFDSVDQETSFAHFKRIIDQGFLSVSDKHSQEQTSVFRAVVSATANRKVWDYMFEHGVDLKADDNESVLMTVAEKNNLEGMKYFLDKGANIQYINPIDERNAILVEAGRFTSDAEKEISELFKFLVDQGSDLTLKGSWNRPLLSMLSDRKRNKSLKYVFTKVITSYMDQLTEENREEIFDRLFTDQQYAPAKKEKEFMVKTLAKFPEFSERIAENITSPKVKLREIASKTLMALDKPEHLIDLKDRFEVESNKAILTALETYLKNK